MDRYKDIKKTIGFLIKYYRKKSNLSLNDILYDNSDFYWKTCTICNECTTQRKICSKNTLYRLENGRSIQNECVYHRLSNKIGKSIILNRYDIYEKIDIYRKLLKDDLIDYSKSKLKKLEIEISNDFEKYKNILYVSELLLLYKCIIQEKLYRTNIKKENIQLFKILLDILLDEDRKLILYYFYTGTFKRGDYNLDLEEIQLECNKYINDPLFYQMKLDSINLQSPLIALKEIYDREMPNFNLLTAYQKYNLYLAIEYGLTNAYAFEQAYKIILKCLDLVNHSDFDDMILKNCYMRLGFISYCLEKYEDSEKWLLKAFEVNHSLSKDLVILISSLEKLNKYETARWILKNIDASKLKAIYAKKVYIYYRFKYEKTNLERKDIILLEDYICNEIKPHLTTYGLLHKEIFDNDLKKYVQVTRNFEKYYKFSN